MPDIHVKRIKVGELVDFAEEAENNPHRYEDLPITRIRALAHARNPVAAEDDIGLLVAYDGDRCIGYLSFLPCRLMRRGKTAKIYAGSTFYVAEKYRGKKVSVAIMKDAMALDYDLLSTGFTATVDRFNRRHPEWFEDAGALPYLCVHLFPTVSILWKLKRQFSSASVLIRAIQALNSLVGNLGLRYIIYRLISPPVKDRFEGVEIREVTEVHGVNRKSEPEEKSPPKLHRDEDVINWMIRYPWIKEDVNTQSLYYFSHKLELFRYLPFELHDQKSQAQIGFAVFSVSRRNELTILKILDMELNDAAFRLYILHHALKVAFQYKTDIIYAPIDFWDSVRGHLPLRLVTERKQRGYFIHRSTNSAFGDDPRNLELNFCDSDTAFI
jgi:GNAT superfamily N-acetyltransferase